MRFFNISTKYLSDAEFNKNIVILQKLQHQHYKLVCRVPITTNPAQYLQSWTNYIAKSQEIRQNWTRTENIDKISLCHYVMTTRVQSLL